MESLLLPEDPCVVVGSEAVAAVGEAVVEEGTGTPRLAAQSGKLWPYVI
jgi:hypothetical protein